MSNAPDARARTDAARGQKAFTEAGLRGLTRNARGERARCRGSCTPSPGRKDCLKYSADTPALSLSPLCVARQRAQSL